MSDAGGVLSDIVGESASAAVVLEIEQALGIDGEFPAALNLVEMLQSIIQPLCGDNTKADTWSDALRVIQEVDGTRKNSVSWARVAPTSRAGNPLGGRFKSYPIAAFFLQEPMAGLGGQAILIKRLFLAVLLQRPNPQGLHSVADELRKEIARGGTRSSIHKLPETPDAGWTVLARILASLPESDLLAVRLRKLLKMAETPRAIQSPNAHPQGVLTPPEASATRTTFKTAPASLVPGHHTQMAEPGDSQTAEPPTYADLYIAEPDLGEGIEPASELEVDAHSRETRYWISRHQRITPNDAGRLTSIERRWVAATLRDLLQSDDAALRMGAGLVALMYVTGMQFETLINTGVGVAGVFDMGGVYRRDIRAPTNAYTPDAELIDQFLPRESVLPLQLPAALTQWVDTLVRQSKRTVLECLGVDSAKADESVGRVMRLLRAEGRYARVRRERMPAALAIELSLKYRDFGLTHYLASGPGQAAPMSNYYVVHFIEDLKRHYREVAGEMLPAL